MAEVAEKKSIGRSILAVVVGFVSVFILSYGMDYILVAFNVLPDDASLAYVSSGVVFAVLAYRTIFNAVGCYIAAKLAPNHPMRHAIILGTLGFLLGIGGALATDPDAAAAAPDWYGWGLVLGALPAAWLGGKLYTMRATKR